MDEVFPVKVDRCCTEGCRFATVPFLLLSPVPPALCFPACNFLPSVSRLSGIAAGEVLASDPGRHLISLQPPSPTPVLFNRQAGKEVWEMRLCAQLHLVAF